MEEQEVKNASQTEHKRLLVDLAVRRCAGMQPAARWARWQGAKGSGKARRIFRPVSSLFGGEEHKATTNLLYDQGSRVAQIAANGGAAPDPPRVDGGKIR